MVSGARSAGRESDQERLPGYRCWAYAWALVFLVGAGLGRWLLGAVRGRGDLAASGGWLITAGLVGFLEFAVIFEVVVRLSGHRSGRPAATPSRPIDHCWPGPARP
jgi:hypothetical protein